MTDKEEKILASYADYQQTFNSPHGKKVLQDLINRTGFLENNYVPGDPHGTSFNEGQTSIVRQILNKLKMDIKKLEAHLLKENEDADFD